MNCLVWQKEQCSTEQAQAMTEDKADSKSADFEGKLHWQTFVQFKKAIRPTALFKFFPKGVWWNEVARSVPNSIEYCRKDDTRVKGEESHTLGDAPTIARKSTQLGKLVKDFRTGMSRVDCYNKYPEVAINKGRQIDHWISVVSAVTTTGKWKFSDFESDEKLKPGVQTWEPITDWSKTHIFWGKPGCGKTQFALAHFKNCLWVTHKDDLKKLDPLVHDGIIFDDRDWKYWPRSVQIDLTDIDQPRSIDVKHGFAVIPANTKKIWTTNIENGDIFLLDDEAIRRRLTITHLQGSHNPNNVLTERSDWLPHQRQWDMIPTTRSQSPYKEVPERHYPDDKYCACHKCRQQGSG